MSSDHTSPVFYPLIQPAGCSRLTRQSVTIAMLMVGGAGLSHQVLAADKKAAIDEVVVQARKSDFTEITEEAGKLVAMPGSLGDPLLASYSLPGVLASEGDLGAPAVRGSGPSDNAYLVDGIPAAYIFHAFSTSIFNENILQDFNLYSAGFGPQYSNVTGGVFDVRLRQPKNQPLTTKVDVSVLRSGLIVEGAAGENSEFYASGRYSMLQFFVDKDEGEKKDGVRLESPPEDSDYQAKYVWRATGDSEFTLSANGATDFVEAAFNGDSDLARKNPDFLGAAKIERGFNNQSLHWQYRPDAPGEWNIYIAHFLQSDKTYWGNRQYYFDRDWSDNFGKITYDVQWRNTHNLSVGADYHQQALDYDTRQVLYLCTPLDPDCESHRAGVITDKAHLSMPMANFFVNDHWEIFRDWQWDIGFVAQRNDYNKETRVQSRTALAWQFSDGWTATAAAGQYSKAQDVEFIAPKFGNPQLPLQRAEHYTLGLKQELEDSWSWTLNTYYKNLYDLPLARSDKAPTTDPVFTNDATGYAYGADLLINKGRTDKWFGWMALGYAKSTRRNELTGERKDYYLDTPVVFNLVANYQFSSSWNGGLRFVAHTGQASTPILDIKENPDFPGLYQPVYGDPFSENLPVYARLDIRFKKDTELFGYPAAFTFDILNATNRKNVTDKRLDYEKVNATHELAIEKSVGLGIIPSVGMSITF